MARDILIVDDESDIRVLVAGILDDEGYQARTAGTAEEALEEIVQRRPSLVVLDIWLQGSKMDGIEVLQRVRSDDPSLPVIVISGHGNIDTAVAAIKLGAYDYVEKPFKADRLVLCVGRAIEAARLKQENSELRVRVGEDGALIGRSATMAGLRHAVGKVAPTSSRILITGPPGCGKELVARLIHQQSARSEAPFVILNCANMVPERLEAQLFGVESGTENLPRVIGTLETAHGGTLYLDEVADMPVETQSKILRVLQDQQFRRVGGETTVSVDVRIISSTSRNLEAEIEERRFREDLYYRLNVVPVQVPALADRAEDIPEIVRAFMTRSAESAGISPCRLSDDALAALQAYEWPGNVRELRNVVERILIMSRGDPTKEIRREFLPSEIIGATPPVLSWDRSAEVMAMPLRDAREAFEREYLLAQITRFGGNISRTANFVGMERSALHRKLKLLGVYGTEKRRDYDA